MAEQTEKYREGIDRSLKFSPEEHPERHLTEAEREAGVEEYDEKVSSIEKERGEGKESASTRADKARSEGKSRRTRKAPSHTAKSEHTTKADTKGEGDKDAG